MRRLLKLIAVVVVCLLAVGVAGPAAANHDPYNPSQGHGGSGNQAVWVTVDAVGGAKGSYPSCPWRRGWPDVTSATTESRSVPSILESFLGILGSLFGGGPSDPAMVELVPVEEADLNGDGEVDQDFTVPILDGDDEYVIGETENLDWVNELLLSIRGTHDLGVFIPDANADLTEVDLALMDEDQRRAIEEGARYLETGNYPIVERGRDPVTNDPLFWDPWYVAVGEASGGCPAGVIYSPRLNRPPILLPDLHAFVVELLPDAVPTIRPTDATNGWAYVQVPTNFGVAASSLARQSAHAEVLYIDPATGTSSPLWAEIQAFPTNVLYDPGDGSPVVDICHVTELAYDPTNPGDCSYTYLDSSNTAGGTFEATVTVIWRGLYTDSTGANEIIEVAPISATFPIEVAEARPQGATDR